MERGNAVLAELDLNGDPIDALDRLVLSSWTLLDNSRALLAAAQPEMSPGRIRDLQATIEERVQRLIERGRREGASRTDVPTAWLTAVMHALMHAAAEEASAGRLAAEEVPELMATPGEQHPRRPASAIAHASSLRHTWWGYMFVSLIPPMGICST